MLARVKTSTVSGVSAASVDVEVHVREGKPYFTIIGLGDGAIRESRDRILSALRHSGFRTDQQVLVNLAPAELKKEGSAFDLPIALGILIASGQLSSSQIDAVSVHGELALDGQVKPIRGAVALSIQAVQSGLKELLVPQENVNEANLIDQVKVTGVKSLLQAVRYLLGQEVPERVTQTKIYQNYQCGGLSEVWGQEKAKRALLIAASGGHNLLMIGPPGCGKSMLAHRFPSLLPALREEELLEVVKIHSIAGLPIQGYLGGMRPYRSPHHGISDAGLVGGGSIPRPGEISLAHRGVLFLDEFPEFRRSALESLRAPLETGTVSVARAKGCYEYPASFQFIAAMNPCPCGRLGSSRHQCTCSKVSIQNYLKKLSQPILDRIDLHVELEDVGAEVLARKTAEVKAQQKVLNESDSKLRDQVLEAQEIQLSRNGDLNARVAPTFVGEHWQIKPAALELLKAATDRLSLSARGFMRVLRVARTIADLEARLDICAEHVAEAMAFRSLDRIAHYAGIGK